MATTLSPKSIDGFYTFTPETAKCFYDSHDNCSKCNKHFVRGEITYIGKCTDGNFEHVCASCSDNLIELEHKTDYAPRNYAVPPKDASLWRYMDFAKYVSILSDKALFFSSAKGFEDNFEGALSEADSKIVWEEQFIKEQTRLFKHYYPNITDDELLNKVDNNRTMMEYGFRQFKKINCVSCWHENDGESVAMWDLYSRDYSNAIAIKTTHERLYRSFGWNYSLHIGRVNYIDYRTQFPDVNDLFFYKRKSFKHENEVRVVLQDDYAIDNSCESNGLLKPIDISTLIEKVYISPKAPERLIKLIKSVNTAFGFPNIPVEKSGISRIPS